MAKPLKYILLDSCIFEHLGVKDLQDQILKILEESVKNGYGLAFSQYTYLEIIDNASLENEMDFISRIKGVKQFQVKQNILIAAGHLGGLYKDDGMEYKQQPEKGDKILGATAFATESIIYTTNGRHFPRPFFKEVGSHWLTYKKGERDAAIKGYFLEIDRDYVIQKHDERINPKPQQLPAVQAPAAPN